MNTPIPDPLRDHWQPCACEACWHLQLRSLPHWERDRTARRYWPVETFVEGGE